MLNKRGFGLIEVLISILIIVVASIATLSYFGSTRGFIGKTGNRRAALERARERLEQIMATNISQLPPQNGSCYYCTAATCTAASWIAYACGTVPTSDTVSVGSVPNPVRRETTVQFVDDPSAGTGLATRDVYEFGVKVWFLPGATDNDFNRVNLRTLRTSS